LYNNGKDLVGAFELRGVVFLNDYVGVGKRFFALIKTLKYLEIVIEAWMFL
jgi:hypothetical protein